MQKKALVLVQGINSKSYIEDQVKASRFPSDEYKLVYVDTEKIFDRTIPGIIKVLPLVGKWYDQYVADIRAFFRNAQARKDACRLIRKTVLDLQHEGYDVSVLAHSLGTLMAITFGPAQSGQPIKIKKLFLYNSPLGISIGFGAFGIFVRQFTRKFISVTVEDSLEYIYSSHDSVSKDYKPAISKILDGLCRNKFRLDTLQDHNLENNINERYSLAGAVI